MNKPPAHRPSSQQQDERCAKIIDALNALDHHGKTRADWQATVWMILILLVSIGVGGITMNLFFAVAVEALLLFLFGSFFGREKVNAFTAAQEIRTELNPTKDECAAIKAVREASSSVGYFEKVSTEQPMPMLISLALLLIIGASGLPFLQAAQDADIVPWLKSLVSIVTNMKVNAFFVQVGALILAFVVWAVFDAGINRALNRALRNSVLTALEIHAPDKALPNSDDSPSGQPSPSNTVQQSVPSEIGVEATE